MAIDVLFCILLLLAIYKGYSKGLIVAVFSFFAIIIGLAAAVKLSALVAGWLKASTNISLRWLPFIAFALVMISIILLMRLAAGLLQKSAEFMLMGWANRIGGILLYAAIYTMVYSVFLFFAVQLQLLKPETTATSKCFSFIEPLGPMVINGFGKLVPLFKDLFSQLEAFFAQAAGHAA